MSYQDYLDYIDFKKFLGYKYKKNPKKRLGDFCPLYKRDSNNVNDNENIDVNQELQQPQRIQQNNQIKPKEPKEPKRKQRPIKNKGDVCIKGVWYVWKIKENVEPVVEVEYNDSTTNFSSNLPLENEPIEVKSTLSDEYKLFVETEEKKKNIKIEKVDEFDVDEQVRHYSREQLDECVNHYKKQYNMYLGKNENDDKNNLFLYKKYEKNICYVVWLSLNNINTIINIIKTVIHNEKLC